MTYTTVEISDNLVGSLNLSKKQPLSKYIEKLVKEDLLLKEIKESENSGIMKMNSLDDLDN